MRHLWKNVRPRRQPGATQSYTFTSRAYACIITIFNTSARIDDLTNDMFFFPAGKDLQLQNMRQNLQEVVHIVHAPPHPLRHQTVSLSVLRQTLPPEIGYEKTHVHSYRWFIFYFFAKYCLCSYKGFVRESKFCWDQRRITNFSL